MIIVPFHRKKNPYFNFTKCISELFSEIPEYNLTNGA